MLQAILIIAVIAACLLRIFSGIDNGCYYAKGNRKPPELAKYMDNLHFVETPFWWLLFGMFGLLVFGLLFYATKQPWYYNAIESFLITRGASAMASYHYQKFINIGSGLPAVDPNENPKSEFAWGPIQFWWPRFGYGSRRKYIPFFGVAVALLGIILTLF